jgi:hypothetical protein
MNKRCAVSSIIIGAIVFLCPAVLTAQHTKAATDHPKIVNIINFIRLLEPRDTAITQDVLYQTVVQQVDMMRRYKLGGSFLLQYDALMDSRYQNLLKQLPKDSFEIGAWWEIPQPMVEKAGLKWRGRYAWDWHADVGFSTGYTPAERELLADVYMNDFKSIFGYYPASVASWFIDAHTLNYLYEKYHITASANCKDQYGTDGYTLWGGYWNQAYYPSKINAYMPAQHAANQLPVPIFRMLGSDPVRQYDEGLGNKRQGVITLEPVYPLAGGDSAWVNWYFQQFITGAGMAYSYTQAGQENSFTWNAMQKGFNIQLPLIAQLRNQHKIRVETLAASGKWFKDHYTVTQATSVTVNKDADGSDRKTIWFNSRFYRANLLWEKGTLRFRDIHLFDETLPSFYTANKASSNECSFFTLPFVDGYLWSSAEKRAGLYFKAKLDGNTVLLEGADPVISDAVPGKLHIRWPLKNCKATLVMDINETTVKITMSSALPIDWWLDLNTATTNGLPFSGIKPNAVDCLFEQMHYTIAAISGSFSVPAGGSILRIGPASKTIQLNFGVRPARR